MTKLTSKISVKIENTNDTTRTFEITKDHLGFLIIGTEWDCRRTIKLHPDDVENFLQAFAKVLAIKPPTEL